MPLFDGLGHVALKVRDLDASLDFYQKLGFPEMLRLLDKDGSPWISYLRVNDNLYLELFPGGPEERVPENGHTGLAHLCLTSPDLDATEKGLAALGISLSQPRKTGRGVDGNRGMWVEDPDGNRIEIMEMAPDCIQFKAVENLHAGGAPHALALR